MSTNKAVRTLHHDLTRLNKAHAQLTKAQTAEKKAGTDEAAALAKIQTEKQQVIDQFAQTPTTDTAAQAKLLGQLFDLGTQDAKARNDFATQIAGDKKTEAADQKTIGKDRKQALKDLKPAEYHLSLKDTNAARKQLDLKPLKKPLRDQFKPGSFHKGPGTEYGADTSSSYEDNAKFQASIKGKPFTAIKATDGLSANQDTFKSRWNELGKLVKSGKMKLRIAYHFLEPGESGVAQAKKFLQTVGIHGKLQAGTRLALDWESNLQGVTPSTSTLRDAATYIHKVTGVWPLIYSTRGNAAAAHSAVPHAPQWLAGVADGAGDPLPSSQRDRNVPFFQYSWKPWDLDQFNGNMKALEKFAGY